MVNNKISIDRFFEVGGVCEIILATPDGIDVIHPQNYAEYLSICLNISKIQWIKNDRWWWEGWYYEPRRVAIRHLNGARSIGDLYLFKTKKKE